MTIIDAIKSGKRFRRGSAEWFSRYQCGYLYQGDEDHRTYQFRYYVDQHDLLADDWEIEEKWVEITRSQLEEALSGRLKWPAEIDYVAKRLGL